MSSHRQFLDKLAAAPPAPLNVLMASLTGPGSSPAFYERALRRRHHVMTFGPYRGREFWRSQAETLKQHAYYRAGTAEYWEETFSRLAQPCDITTARGIVDLRQLRMKLPGAFQPDLFLWIEQYDWNMPIHLEVFDCPKVAIFGDTHIHQRHPEKWATWLQYARLYDFVFVSFNRPHAKFFKDAGCPNVHWSPAACDPEIHCKTAGPKSFAVSFVGSTHPAFHPERNRLLDFVRRNNVELNIDAKVLQDMSRVFSQSKIVLNRSIGDDLNMRVFETLGTGTLLLTNRLSRESGLEELFKDREHLAIYDEEDLLDRIHFYLENDAERERIALAGYTEALRNHTYDDRVEEILNVIRRRLCSSQS